MKKVKSRAKNVGPYILGKTIGNGTFGKVKIAKHSLTEVSVAVKILKKKEIKNETDFRVIEREIHILKKLKHKNVIQFYESIQTHSHIYIILELVEGELLDFIRKKKKLEEAEAHSFFQQIIQTLEYLHDMNISHRDLKPENLLIDNGKTLKFSDFGLATMYANDRLLSTPCGTLYYAAPEILRGDDYHGLSADVWSAGVILFSMIVGNLPFSNTNGYFCADQEYIRRVLNDDFEIPGSISKSLEDLLRKMLTKDPLKRISLEEVLVHPWYLSNTIVFYKGIKPNSKIPVDENILDLVAKLGLDRELTRLKVSNNEFDHLTACYYLLVKRNAKEGKPSISDLVSDEYLDYAANQVDRNEDSSLSNGSSEFSIDIEDEKPLSGKDQGDYRKSIQDYYMRKSVNFEEFKGEIDEIPVGKNSIFLGILEKKISKIEEVPSSKRLSVLENLNKKKSILTNHQRFSIKLNAGDALNMEEIDELSYSDNSVDVTHPDFDCQICKHHSKQHQLLKGNSTYSRLSQLFESSKFLTAKPTSENLELQFEQKNSITIAKTEEIVISNQVDEFDKPLTREEVNNVIKELRNTMKITQTHVDKIFSLTKPTVNSLIEILNQNVDDGEKENEDKNKEKNLNFNFNGSEVSPENLFSLEEKSGVKNKTVSIKKGILPNTNNIRVDKISSQNAENGIPLKGKTYSSIYKKSKEEKQGRNETGKPKTENELNKTKDRGVTMANPRNKVKKQILEEVINEENESNANFNENEEDEMRFTFQTGTNTRKNFATISNTFNPFHTISKDDDLNLNRRHRKTKSKRVHNFSNLPEKVLEKNSRNQSFSNKNYKTFEIDSLAEKKLDYFETVYSSNNVDEGSDKKLNFSLKTQRKNTKFTKKTVEKLPHYNGPVDLSCVILSEDYLFLVKEMIKFFFAEKINFIEKGLFNFICSFEKIKFSVEIFSLDIEEYFTKYCIFLKSKRIVGDNKKYTKVINSIISNLKNSIKK